MLSLTWARDLVVDWVVISFSIALSVVCPYCIPLSVFIVGNRQHALSILGHDATHKLVSKNRFINESLGNYFCYSPLLIPWREYRSFHAKHHKFLGTTKDPELPIKEKLGLTEENATKRRIVSSFFADLFFLGISLESRLKPRRKDLRDWAIVHFLILSLGIACWQIPLIWYLSIISSGIAFARLRVWHEHVGTDKTHKISASWWQRILFLPHYAEYHHEHHEYPSVPYNLLHSIAEEDRVSVCDIHRRSHG